MGLSVFNKYSTLENFEDAVIKWIDHLAIPGLSFEALDQHEPLDRNSSFLGGTPVLSSGEKWPERNGVPMAFIACLNLIELNKIMPGSFRLGGWLNLFVEAGKDWFEFEMAAVLEIDAEAQCLAELPLAYPGLPSEVGSEKRHVFKDHFNTHINLGDIFQGAVDPRPLLPRQKLVFTPVISFPRWSEESLDRPDALYWWKIYLSHQGRAPENWDRLPKDYLDDFMADVVSEQQGIWPPLGATEAFFGGHGWMAFRQIGTAQPFLLDDMLLERAPPLESNGRTDEAVKAFATEFFGEQVNALGRCGPVQNHIFADPSPFQSLAEPGVLLFSLSGNYETGLNLGGGELFVWIKPEDLAAGIYDHVWGTWAGT